MPGTSGTQTCPPRVLSVLISLSTLTNSCRFNRESWDSLCNYFFFLATTILLHFYFSRVIKILLTVEIPDCAVTALQRPWRLKTKGEKKKRKAASSRGSSQLTSSPFWRGRHLVSLEVELQISFYKFMYTFGISVFSSLPLETEETFSFSEQTCNFLSFQY